MFQFFDGISSMLGVVVDFIKSLVATFITFVVEIPKAFGFLVSAVAYLPPFLMTFVLPFIGICILLNLINKGS